MRVNALKEELNDGAQRKLWLDESREKVANYEGSGYCWVHYHGVGQRPEHYTEHLEAIRRLCRSIGR